MHSRYVADLLESPLDHHSMPYAITFSTPSMHCVSTAPAPISLASVDSENGYVHTGRARIGGDVKASIRALKTLFCCLNLGSLSKSEMGANTVLYWGTNCRKYTVMPSSTRTCSTVFGLDSCVIASILLGAGISRYKFPTKKEPIYCCTPFIVSHRRCCIMSKNNPQHLPCFEIDTA